MASMKRADIILGETFGCDYKEIQDCRYQRYANPNVYSMGDKYYAVHRNKPNHEVGEEWRENVDQYGARETGRKIWVCNTKGTE